MSSLILIMSSVLLSLIVAHLLFKKFNILAPLSKKNVKVLSFMSDEESLKYISEKAELNDEEKVVLEIIHTLVSGAKLHQGFEDLELLKKWLISVRKAIAKREHFDNHTKEELEYYSFEIFRKMNNKRMLLNPSVKTIFDISIGQIMEIKALDNIIKVELIEKNFHTFCLNVSVKDYKIIRTLKLDKKLISITFWKIMDAHYRLKTKIVNIEKTNGQVFLHCSIAKTIECIQIRSYPRQNVEIPIKFRQGITTVDSDSGALQEEFSGYIFGIINNIGPKGCSIISHSPIPENTLVQIEIPLFDQLFYFKGSIRSIVAYHEIYTLHAEFCDDIIQDNVLQIYKYIFSNKISNNVNNSNAIY